MTAEVSSVPIWEVAYTRDQLGRITEKVETIQGATDSYVYRYDLAGRLEEVEVNGLVTATYTFDANGNRLSKTTSGGTETGSYDAQDRLLAYDGTTYTYTRNGELATATDAGGTTSFSYDVFGNLLEVTPPGGPEIEYVVDARNRRIGKKLDGTLVQGLLWQSQLAPIAELDGAGAVVSRFVHATRVNVPDYMTRAGSTYRILADHLGSPRLVVDTTTGTVVQRMDFDEWGIVLADTNPGWTPFGFAGGLSEPMSGLVRFGARDFDTSSGRWAAKDPIAFEGGSLSLFVFLAGDPMNRSDASGLACTNLWGNPVPAKPEKGDPFLLGPGATFDGDIDGVMPPSFDGDWLKVSDGTDVVIQSDGTPAWSWRTTPVPSAPGAGGLVDHPVGVTLPPVFPDWPLVRDYLPGRGREPDWSSPQRHPDWRLPDDPSCYGCGE